MNFSTLSSERLPAWAAFLFLWYISAMDLLDSMKSVYADASALRDRLGLIKAKVWLYRKDKGQDAVWKQLLPTPKIRYVENLELQAGGVAEAGEIILKGIPQSLFTETELLTFSSEDDQKRFIVIQPPGRADSRLYELADKKEFDVV